jgi:hypothetical protein
MADFGRSPLTRGRCETYAGGHEVNAFSDETSAGWLLVLARHPPVAPLGAHELTTRDTRSVGRRELGDGALARGQLDHDVDPAAELVAHRRA